ncbi:efflux RND transporter periplasmic adaptor subunit [Vibrio viridaestus]|uniref:efflux RND transporter periplasmic adaptor subunit n=1 Tax=Vibrio viridaestus TaxID=2487322 RepID=UPI001AA04FB9|nr:efflux RND transporter periplasmic adaptor subunit [Vibrio viridaestus]
MSRHNILTMAIITALPLVLTACGEEKLSDPRTEAPLVRTVTISTPSAESRSFTGVVAARIESDLGFRVSGKVLKRLVDTGQVVKRGQVLMRLDPVDQKLAAHAQQESVVAAEARAKQAAEDEARYRDLRGTGAISASDYDQVKAAADTAQAQLRAAQAQAEVAMNATRYTDLVADADGTVVETFAEPGQVVSAGQRVVRVAHAGAREALIQLPETLRPSLGSYGQAQLLVSLI